ncbi:EamA family transporter [Kurthia massiliensis]|uniref:EamA family transporter n=1 Tax=Kurthia massiliensis TaxID=1033739 RepID=UPI000287F7C3|nr:DMT family transporter [Kurthia massiliensis]
MNKLLLYPLLIVLASSSYGILSTIIKVAMHDGFSTSEAVTSQYAVGFFLAAILFICTQRSLPKLNGKGFLILCIGGLLTGTTGIVYGQAVHYLPASVAVVMLFQFTWIGVLLDCAVHRRKPKRSEVFSMIILIIGTILAAGLIDADIAGLDWRGWAYGFASAISFACFMQFNSKQVDGVNPISRMTIMAFFSLVIISVFQSPEIIYTGTLFTTDLLYYGLALGFFGIILPILLFSIAVPKVGGALASILSATELPVAILASVIVLHEQLTLIQVLGIVIVLAGMTLPTILEQRRKPLA